MHVTCPWFHTPRHLLRGWGRGLPKNGLYGEGYKNVNEMEKDAEKGGRCRKNGGWEMFQRQGALSKLICKKYNNSTHIFEKRRGKTPYETMLFSWKTVHMSFLKILR